jgi:ankyrin repeat protein
MNSFEYNPIDHNEARFRLLWLCSGSDGPIKCGLFHARLDKLTTPDNAFEYEALSYTWGASDRPNEITINGNRMPVTMNLFQALWNLRYPDKGRILWIDAICINQENLEERGHQVKQMASIYKKAQRVVVWLGQSSLDTDSLFHDMCKLENLANKHAYHEWTASDQRWQRLWSIAKPMANGESTYWLPRQRRALDSVLRHPWFTRVWIIQEIANARSATIMCGTSKISSRIFAAMPSLLGIHLDAHCQAIFDVMPGPLRKYSWWAQNRDLRTLLLKFQWSRASEPRDSIYALLGISSDACNAELLLPNYVITDGEVVQNTVGFLLSVRDPHLIATSLPQWTFLDLVQSVEFLCSNVLHWSAENGHEAMVRHLLKLQVSGSEQLKIDEETLIPCLARKGRATICTLLHDAGIIDLNTGGKERPRETFLMQAATDGNARLMRFLLDTKRVETDIEDQYGRTALTMAVKFGNRAVVKLLLNNTARPDMPNTSMLRLIKWATKRGKVSILKLLLEAPDINTVTRKTPQQEIFRAIEYGCKEGTDLVDFQEADLNVNNEDGETPLLLAVQDDDAAMVKMLVNTGKVDLRRKCYEGRSPFLEAVVNGQLEMVKLLLSTCDLCANDLWAFGGRQTPLTFAIIENDDMVKVMIDSGKFDPNGTHRCGDAPLHCAIECWNNTALELLLDVHNIDINAEDEYGRTPLMQAVRFGRDRSLRKLIETDRVEINKKGVIGRTALHWAAMEAIHNSATEILLSAGADADLEDDSGKTALDLALESDSERTIEILKSHRMISKQETPEISQTRPSRGPESRQVKRPRLS